MKKRRLIWLGLRFHRRTNLYIALGAAIASTVLTGALMVGDSVRFSLTRLTLSRLGKSDFILVARDRFFQADLAGRMKEASGARMAAVLLLDGIAISPEGDRRVNAVQVAAVDDSFWELSPEPMSPPHLENGECLVNSALARGLDLTGPGDAFVLRLHKPGGLPADLTLATRDRNLWSRRLHVAGIQTPETFGNFTIRTVQSPPPTVFLPLSWLNAQLDIPDRANVLLIADPEETAAPGTLQADLDASWRLEDAGLRAEQLPDGSIELLTDRVFIAPPVADAVFQAAPDTQPVITYFVNTIAHGDAVTPYSFVSAPGPPRVPDSLGKHEALINDWLAEDLGATTGSVITLTYYTVDGGGRLDTRSNAFSVAGIIPADTVAETDRRLTPHIPGLSDAANCRDWDPGIPIRLDKIRDKDEAYWNEYGPLPKVYLTRDAAVEQWGNRFGTYTSLRLRNHERPAASVLQSLQETGLRARDMGLIVHPAKAEGLAASRDAVDFGHLFMGLSFFLIVSAILLTTLLFTFHVQQRAEETGTLRALGFLPQTTGGLLMAEGSVLVLFGALIGTVLAMGYNCLMLFALRTVWYDAVRTEIFRMHIRPSAFGIGVAGVVLTALAGMALAIRKQARWTLRELQQGEPETILLSRKAVRRALAAGGISIAAALLIVATALTGQGREAVSVFFISGILVLAGILGIAYGGIGLLQNADSAGTPGLAMLAVRGAVRRRKRSLACITLIALGMFLVIAVAANRRGTVRNPEARDSGTGGWLLWGQTTLPLIHDLNTRRGRAAYGLTDGMTEDVLFTQLRLYEGDDASCLNLNRVANPHLLGVDPAAMDRRGAFTFSRLADEADPGHPWLTLHHEMEPDIIPAFADMADIVWGLDKGIGDTLPYTDETGRSFEIKLMGGLSPSILQGHLIIAESRLMERFPSIGGTRVLLVDAPRDRLDILQRTLTQRLADTGLACVPAAERLAEFNSVENTYLSIFMLLGGLGVLLGTAGLGVIAARNILERRGELALLRAVGFSRQRLRRIIFIEHAALAVAGTLAGLLAAGIAVIPALLAPESETPWAGLLITLLAVPAGSLLWIWSTLYAVMRAPLLLALRKE